MIELMTKFIPELKVQIENQQLQTQYLVQLTNEINKLLYN